MVESEVDVMMGPPLSLDDLMELKYSTLDDSIQLIPLDATYVTNETNIIKENTEEENLKTNLEICKAAKNSVLNKPLVREDGRYSCPLCDKTFAQKHIVPRHIRSKHENFYNKCDECGQLVRNLKQHMRYRHSGRQVVKCVICGTEKESKRELREHLASDHGDICVPTGASTLPRSCPTCGVTLQSKKSLWLSHIYPQHMVPRRYFSCPIPSCARSVSKLDDDHSLKLHLSNHHGHKVDKVHHCHLCPQKLLDSGQLKDHLAEDHHGLDHIQCPQCDKTFPRFQLMALHVYQDHEAIFRGWVGCDKPEIELPSFEPKRTSLKTDNSVNCNKLDDQSNPAINEIKIVNNTNPKHLLKSENFPQVDETKVQCLSMSKLTLPKGTRIVKTTETEIYLEVEDNIELVNADENVNVKDVIVEVNNETIEESRSNDREIDPVVNINQISQEIPDQIPENSCQLVGADDPILLNTSVDSDGQEIVLETEGEHNNEIDGEHNNISKQFDDPIVKRRPVKIGTYPCSWPGCQKTFVARHSVAVHIRSVHLPPEGGVPCDKCGKKYRTFDNLKLHQKTVHEAVASSCTWPGCDKVLVSSRQMRSHLLKHTEHPRTCSVSGCESVLKNSNVFRMHMKKIHGGKLSEKSLIKTKIEKKVIADPGVKTLHALMPTITTYKLK